MDIKGSVVLVTGANRGIGRALVGALLEAGATKVYAAARKIETLDRFFHNNRVLRRPCRCRKRQRVR